MSTHRVSARGESTSLADRKRRAGQRLIIGLPGPGVDRATRRLIQQLRPAGFVLFGRNVEEPAQVRELNAELTALLPAELPPLLAVDQEGGRVQRIRDGATTLPPPRWVGNCQDLELSARYGAMLGQELRAMGFNLSLGPVADLDMGSPVIGDRSFGSQAQPSAWQVHTQVQQLHAQGLLTCPKHFPGHGASDTDSHETLPVVERERPQLEEAELAPFRAAIRAGAPCLMSAHVVFPAWDEDLPATLSRRVLFGVLRQQLGFGGLIVSDDLEMKALAGRFPLEQQLSLATRASLDLFLIGSDPHLQLQAYEQLVYLQEEDPAQDRLAEDTQRRLLAARERFFLGAPALPPLEVLDSEAHRAIVMQIRARGED